MRNIIENPKALMMQSSKPEVDTTTTMTGSSVVNPSTQYKTATQPPVSSLVHQKAPTPKQSWDASDMTNNITRPVF